MTILITGAQFGNKGAQSLLACAVNEIKNSFPDARILFMPVDTITNYSSSDLSVELVYDDGFPKDNNVGIKKVYRYYQHLINLYRIKASKMKVLKLSKILTNIDYLIDVSGYSLSTNWPLEINNRLLRYINNAKAYNIPVFLLPQSFGPFTNISHELALKIRSALDYATIVFARERKSKDELISLMGNDGNIYVYPDLVICSDEPKPESIFKNYSYSNFEIKTKNNVGIIPNTQLLIKCDEETLINIYREIINKLSYLNKNIYIFRHSSDLDLCKKIYKHFEQNNNVFLIENEFDCFQFGYFLNNFDFIIASRYHAIVHGYKHGVPSIILGWAIKYEELAKRFGQEMFVFEVDKSKDITGEVVDAITLMNAEIGNYKKQIIDSIVECRKHSCMNEILEYIQKNKQ